MDVAEMQEQAYEEVALVEQIAASEGLESLSVGMHAQPIATPKPVPVLNGTPQSEEMPAWLRILPSRQKPAA
jgi:hypothetical protein